jgi:hypothetical protein
MDKTNRDVSTLKQDVRALRDELKVQVHLAGMQAKQEWAKLQPEVDHVIANTAVVSREVLDDFKKRLVELRRRIKS